jgi:hypothetical protein
MADKLTKANKPKSKSTPHPFTTLDAAAALRHFQPLAMQIPESDLGVCTVDVEIARHNIDRGVAALRPHLSLVRVRLPLCPVEALLELPALALALIFATDRVISSPSDGETADRLAKMRPLREVTLCQLEVLAYFGLVPADRVRAIRAGNGPFDSARDAVAIADLYREFASVLAGKHPFAPAQLAELAEHGNWLLVQLKPAGAYLAPVERSAASLLRDRIWSLIVERHTQLREAGVVVFGLRDLDTNIPPIGARMATVAAKPAAEPSPPASTSLPTSPISPS